MDLIKLNELCDINIGKTPSRSKSEYWGNGHKWIAISDLKEKFIYKTKEEITDIAVDKCNMKVIRKDTVVMSFKLSIGKTAILKEDMFSNEAIANFPIKNKDKIIPEYLYYAIKTLNFDNTDRAVMGATLNKSKLNEIKIPYCDINMQHKIVKGLDKAQELVDKRKEQIECLDELVKSRFIEMFGDPVLNPMRWEKRVLKELVTEDCTISYGIVQTGDEQNEGIPVFRPVDIVNNKKPILNGLKKTTEEISNRYKKTILQGNELLMTVRANIGDTCIIGEEFKGCNVGRGIVPIRLTNELNTVFAKYQLDSYGVQRELKSLAKGITLIQLNMEDLREFPLVIPPIELQNQFTEFVNQIDKLKFDIEKSLKDLEDNINVLMQKSFKGDLFK
ncbi:hypothetical protein KD33_10945 [Clostridium sp. NCR]|nr:hypothetical protein KD33_10945 [Clostridium sp. NCR]